MKKVLLVLLLLCSASTVWHTAAADSKDLLFPRWSEDAEGLRASVINPMNEEYAKKEGPIAWHVYSSDLLTRIRPLRGELQPYSYDFIRKLILSLNETYSGKPDQYNWEDAAQFVDVQLHFIGDIITGVVEQIDGF